MKKERSFRPPQAVLETIVKNEDGSVAASILGRAVPLSDLRKMHAFLRAENAVQKADLWGAYGGNAGLMWAHRVLRQEGIIKGSDHGDVFIPEVVDMQLGPNIIAGYANEDIDTMVEKFQEAGIPASLIPDGDNTFAFFAGDATQEYSLTNGVPELPDITLDKVVVVDESRSKLSSIFKAAKSNVTGVQCKRLESPQMPVDASWESAFLLKSLDFEDQAVKILKVDDELGLVLGWAIICTIDGVEYFDKQGDHIPDNSMLEASADFMLNSRVAKEMHVGDEKGTVVFAWPMTEEIAKSFGIEVQQTGLMIAMKPDNPEMLEKFRDGTYNGFSIGGHRIPGHTEEVD